jgi:hypothetical protein
MNLFVLDRMPRKAAEYNCDAHVRKIILESVEMLGYAFDKGHFKPWAWLHKSGRHLNHPMSLWVRDTKQNFDWTLQHAYALCEEFSYRFGKLHKCQGYLDWIASNLPLSNLRDYEQTDWPRCFGDYEEIVGETENAVYDYRRYYMLAKRHLAKWTRREIPEWYR